MFARFRTFNLHLQYHRQCLKVAHELEILWILFSFQVHLITWKNFYCIIQYFCMLVTLVSPLQLSSSSAINSTFLILFWRFSPVYRHIFIIQFQQSFLWGWKRRDLNDEAFHFHRFHVIRIDKINDSFYFSFFNNRDPVWEAEKNIFSRLLKSYHAWFNFLSFTSLLTIVARQPASMSACRCVDDGA